MPRSYVGAAPARVDVLGRAGPGAGTGRTRSPSAGRRAPPPSGRGALARDHERALADDDADARPDRPRAARRRPSARAAHRCGSCRRSAGSRAAGPRSADLPEVGEELLDLVRAACRAGSRPDTVSAGGQTRTCRWRVMPTLALLRMGRWTRFVLRHRWPRARRLARRPRRRRLRELEARAAALEHLHGPGHRLRAVRQRPRSSTSATGRTARSRSSSGSPTRRPRRSWRGCRRRSTRAAPGRPDAARPTRARPSAGPARRLRRHRLDADARRRRRAYTEPLLRALGPPAGRRARLRHRRRRRSSTTSTRSSTQDLTQGRVDRAADRAARAARRLRPLGRGDDAVPLRGVHDHGRRSGSSTGVAHLADDADLRDEPRRS